MATKGRGRPKGSDRLTPQIQTRIVEALRAGNYIETASAYAGISKQTLYNWLRKGARASSGKYKEFSDAVIQAEAEADVRDVATIAQHSKLNWQASAWRLERKRPDLWGKKERVELSGDSSAPVVVKVVWPEDEFGSEGSENSGKEVEW